MVLAAAVLGIAMIAMGEEIGSEMALRSFGHLVNDFFILRRNNALFFLLLFSNSYVTVNQLLNELYHWRLHYYQYPIRN